MPLKCTACYHPEQAEIDQMLLAGSSLRVVAERFGMSTTSVHRHKQHISKVLGRATEIAEIAKADTLLDQVKNLLSQAERITERAETAGSLDTALRGIAQVRGVLELLGEVSGQLAGKGTNIAIGINAGGAVQPPDFTALSDDQFLAKLRQIDPKHPRLIEGTIRSNGNGN